MEQRGIGKYTIEGVWGKFQLEKILMPDCTSRTVYRHFHERGTAVQSDGTMSEFLESVEVTSGTTA